MNAGKINRELKKRVRGIEKTKGDYIPSVLGENFDGAQHKIVVEGKVFSEVYNETKDELLPLEKADLIDYWNLGENGRTNKARRNLLR